MNRVMFLTFQSSLTGLCERNTSFDAGTLRIAYTGKNYNNCDISKQAFERAIPTLFNCPLVCHYDRETDSIGGHDVEFVSDDDGEIHIVNATTPVGVVPESAQWWWETIEEDDGQEHEYLCAEVLLWKRQEAYQKIKEDGIVGQSMEITVNKGRRVNGVFVVDDFEFTALCLLGDGVTPCFEQASLEVFSLNKFKSDLAAMMSDLKNSLTTTVNTPDGDDINRMKFATEGGETQLDQKIEMLAKFGLTADQVDFDLENMTVEQLEMELKQRPSTHAGDGNGAVSADGAANTFSLTGEQFLGELVESLGTETVDSMWGTISRYIYCDYDAEAKEVFCYDVNDWNLYGFHYSMNGDHVVVDFNSKTRKKVSYENFDEGSADFSYRPVFERVVNAALERKTAELEGKFSEDKEKLERQFSEASKTITDQNAELEKLRQFQKDKLADERTAELNAVFTRFTDLEGNEAFEALRANCGELAADQVEEKCFAIRGRGMAMSFSKKPDNSPVRTPVTQHESKGSEPYGGLFVEFPPVH